MRYSVRWRTSVESGELHITGWDVIDWSRFDRLEVATYPDQETARAIVKLLNTQEEMERTNNVRGT
jgi:hypothetical protein